MCFLYINHLATIKKKNITGLENRLVLNRWITTTQIYSDLIIHFLKYKTLQVEGRKLLSYSHHK